MLLQLLRDTWVHLWFWEVYECLSKHFVALPHCSNSTSVLLFSTFLSYLFSYRVELVKLTRVLSCLPRDVSVALSIQWQSTSMTSLYTLQCGYDQPNKGRNRKGHILLGTRHHIWSQDFHESTPYCLNSVNATICSEFDKQPYALYGMNLQI